MRFTEEKFEPAVDILYTTDHFVAICVNVSDTGITAGADGRKIVPAGTVLGGILADLSKAAVKSVDEVKASEGVTAVTEIKAEGVLYHDVDVSDGPAVGTMIVHGFIDEKRMPAAATTNQKAALNQIIFIGTKA
ncbi:MAG: hypothetical protein RSE47_08415 [Acidaminococcaceae bacterium]